jgi:hypothetical protein
MTTLLILAALGQFRHSRSVETPPSPRHASAVADPAFAPRVVPAVLRPDEERSAAVPRRPADERIADLEWDVAQLFIDEPPGWRPRPLPAGEPIAGPPVRKLALADPPADGYVPPPTRAEFEALAARVKALEAVRPKSSREDRIAAGVAALGPVRTDVPYVPSTVYWPPASGIYTPPPIVASAPTYYAPAQPMTFYQGVGSYSCGPQGCGYGVAPARGGFRLFGGFR